MERLLMKTICQDYSIGHGLAHGLTPIEDDSSVEKVAPVKAKKVSKRRQKTLTTVNKESSKPCTTKEEVALCQAWCNASENNIMRDAMKSRGFLVKGSAQSGLNLNEEADGSEDEVREGRSIGWDQAKKKATSSSRSEASSVAGGGLVDIVADK
uniref:Uncharacterized protein n=1 Tax=Tanacetum cinerariifolium TaxID=118510 RepID=A0A6L2LLV4_TANCI|nr:hypothetical protein [Tanacetum cinerariifolium]